MAVSVSCPKCQASFPVSADLLGKKMRCRGCQTVFVGEAALAQGAARSSGNGVLAPSRPPVDRSAAKPKDNTALLAFTGIGTAVALMAAVTVWALFFRGDSSDNSTPSIASNSSGADKINLGDTLKVTPQTSVADEKPKEKEKAKVEASTAKPKITQANFYDTPKSLPYRIDAATEERVKKSAVWVKVGSEDGGGGTGTGWMVEPGIMITNSHVVGMKDPSAGPPAFVRAVFDSGLPTERIFDAKILGLDRENDLAVCRIVGDNLPDPIPLVRSADLSEGQHLYVVGFPYGAQVAKMFASDKHSLETTVKVRQTTVVGRLPRPSGSIMYVQIEGGASPGNSGSMIVDSGGHVRTVLVAGINPAIVFSIPCEYVVYLLQGRMLSLVPSQPVEVDGTIRQQITAWVADPMKRIKSVALDMWVGEPGRRIRPGSESPPVPMNGDGPRQTVEMAYNPDAVVPVGASREAKCEWKMPEVSQGQGQVFWVQPKYTTPDGKVRWGEAVVMDTPSLPVQRKPATLTIKHKADAKQRVLIESHIGISAAPEGGELHLQNTGMNYDLTEKTTSVLPDGTAKVQLTYNDMRPTDADTDYQYRTMVKGLLETTKGMVADFQVTKRGLIRQPKLGMKNVPIVARAFAERSNAQTIQSLEALALALPDREVQPGETWQYDQNYTVAFGGQLTENALFKTTYQYVGTRVRNGREEAVIEFHGKIVRGEGSQAPMLATEEKQPKGKDKNAQLRIRGMHGEVRGSALVDLATGLTTVARTTGELEFEVPYVLQVLKFGAALRIEMHREVVPGQMTKNARMLLPFQETSLSPFVGSPDHKLTENQPPVDRAVSTNK